MITVNGTVVKPTIFPDGTSQVWKLPVGLFDFAYVKIVWHFEAEREIIDLMSIRALIPPSKHISLHIPYLPYARQDKDVSNDNTFNLHIFADLINNMHFDKITAIDVHNPALTKKLIFKFENIVVVDLLSNLIEKIKPDYLVYPDLGASKRYNPSLSKTDTDVDYLVFEKYRDQSSGNITKHCLPPEKYIRGLAQGTKFLVIDDLCDGGATFIGVANTIKEFCPTADLHLYVTHGLFSKGKDVLTDVGYKLYTTNSIIKNVEGFKV